MATLTSQQKTSVNPLELGGLLFGVSTCRGFMSVDPV